MFASPYTLYCWSEIRVQTNASVSLAEQLRSDKGLWNPRVVLVVPVRQTYFAAFFHKNIGCSWMYIMPGHCVVSFYAARVGAQSWMRLRMFRKWVSLSGFFFSRINILFIYCFSLLIMGSFLKILSFYYCNLLFKREWLSKQLFPLSVYVVVRIVFFILEVFYHFFIWILYRICRIFFFISCLS